MTRHTKAKKTAEQPQVHIATHVTDVADQMHAARHLHAEGTNAVKLRKLHVPRASTHSPDRERELWEAILRFEAENPLGEKPSRTD